MPYFVAVGTWGPRKNHSLLLNVWRELATRGGETPKLICVGGSGFGARQMIESLERSKTLAPHVRRVSGFRPTPCDGFCQCARAARGLCGRLGVALVEALSVGAPVVCSDVPVFRGGADFRAFLSPLDGAGWLTAVRQLAESGSSASDKARRLAHSSEPPN